MELAFSKMPISEISKSIMAALSKDVESIDDFIDVLDTLGDEGEQLRNEILLLLNERLFFWLISTSRPSLNFDERCRFVSKQLLEQFGSHMAVDLLAPDSELVNQLSEIQSTLASERHVKREGINTLAEPIKRTLYKRQNYRCAVCGAPFTSSERKRVPYFPDGLEPIFKASLEHIVPYYLYGNKGEFEILCTKCNSLKNDRLGINEDGLVLSNNHVRRKDGESIKKRMMFWALNKRSGCCVSECDGRPNSITMAIRKNDRRRPFCFPNLVAVCTEHATSSDIWVHD